MIGQKDESFMERNINFVLDPGRHNKLHNLQLHISAVLDVRELTEMLDYEIISEAHALR